MKTNALLAPWKGDQRFTAMAKRAAALSSAARQTISPRQVRDWLQTADVLVEGVSVDESPAAYKDIERVMALQVAAGLLRPLARLRPVAVIMAGEEGDD